MHKTLLLRHGSNASAVRDVVIVVADFDLLISQRQSPPLDVVLAEHNFVETDDLEVSFACFHKLGNQLQPVRLVVRGNFRRHFLALPNFLHAHAVLLVQPPKCSRRDGLGWPSLLKQGLALSHRLGSPLLKRVGIEEEVDVPLEENSRGSLQLKSKSARMTYLLDWLA